MSSAPTHSLQWIYRTSQVQLLSMTRQTPIMLNAKSVALYRQRSTYSLQTRPSRKGRPAPNEPAFSHLLLSLFPLLVHKKCLLTSLGLTFRPRALAFRVSRNIGDVEIYLHHIRCQEIWMAVSTCFLLDP